MKGNKAAKAIKLTQTTYEKGICRKAKSETRGITFEGRGKGSSEKIALRVDSPS